MTAVPESFRALDPYLSKWALTSHQARIQARLASSIAELTQLQQAVLPHMRVVIETLDAYPIEAIPPELEPYGQLVLTVAAYDLAVNRFKQVDVPFAYPLDKIHYLDQDPNRRWE